MFMIRLREKEEIKLTHSLVLQQIRKKRLMSDTKETNGSCLLSQVSCKDVMIEKKIGTSDNSQNELKKEN